MHYYLDTYSWPSKNKNDLDIYLIALFILQAQDELWKLSPNDRKYQYKIYSEGGP